MATTTMLNGKVQEHEKTVINVKVIYTHLHDSFQQRFQPINVTLNVWIQKSQNGRRRQIGSSHSTPH